MRSIVNICLLCLFLFGLMLATDTPWGFAIAAIPWLVWGGAVLNIIHKNIWLGLLFWCVVSFLAWQVTVVALLALLLSKLVSNTKTNRANKQHRSRKKVSDFDGSYSFDYKNNIDISDD